MAALSSQRRHRDVHARQYTSISMASALGCVLSVMLTPLQQCHVLTHGASTHGASCRECLPSARTLKPLFAVST